MLIALLALHFVLAGVAAAGRLGRRVFLVTAVAPAATVLWAVIRAPGVLAGRPDTASIVWVEPLGLRLDLVLDAFSLLMVGLVSGIGTLIFLYSMHYFSDRPDLGRFAGRLVAFSGAMLGLVLSDNLLVVYVFWELTSVTSYLLIGFEDTNGSARAAALQAILTTGMGGLAMLGGFVLIGQAADTYRLSEILATPPSGGAVSAGLLLVLLGAFTKSAQAPFHMWLPGAMAAPTPVSAYLHSATMVKAGIYLVARLAPAFAATAGWRPLVLTVGIVTMILGGLRALRQNDLKLLLAYGTVSQLGFMMVLFGAGLDHTTFAATLLILGHGLFKAALFLIVGVVDHQTHTRDIRRLSGVGRRMPAVGAIAIISAASMAGLPPLFGFIAKETAYDSFLDGSLGGLGLVTLAGLVIGSVLTFAYSCRFVWGGFWTKADHATHDYLGARAPRPALAFIAPATLLAALTVAFGMAPAALQRFLNGAAMALRPENEAHSLALWHGFGAALLLSILTIGVGVVVVLSRTRVDTVLTRFGGWPGADAAYRGSIKWLNHIADRTTGVVQNGSLPTYLAVILLTAVVLPASALLRIGDLPVPDRLADSPVQLVVAAGAATAAFGVVLAQRRFAAVLFLGGVGYGIAVLFVLQGAPDLALTQFLIETLALVLFVLVLRHLPSTYREARWRLGQKLRVAIAGTVGVFIFLFTVIAVGSRTLPPISQGFVERAVPEAAGRNIVNVILVDFRGLDTFGEITVLLVAAIGVASLVRASIDAPVDPDPAATSARMRDVPELATSNPGPEGD